MASENIHATTVAMNQKGILLLGSPGSGKSDLALRLIMNKNAQLVADDRTDIKAVNGCLKASCPPNLQGLLEIRGVGICNFAALSEVEIAFAVQLVSSPAEINRMPERELIELQGVKIPLLKVWPWEISAADKIAAFCYQK